MALREIRTNGDPVLKKVSREVTAFDAKLRQLLGDMADTMHKANGVGLAAVQVGILRRVVVIDIGEGVIELVNPVIVDQSEETINSSEGCLSFPDQWGMVERPHRVTVQAQDRNGETLTITGEGLLARAFCHELDHLDGVVFLDRVSEMIDPDQE